MVRITILLAALVLFYCSPSTGQTIRFKTYRDTVHGFRVDIPAYWKILYSTKQEGYICVPVTKAEKDNYKSCFEGIVFRLEFLNYGLDSLLQEGYEKHGKNYTTSDKVSDNVPVKFIKGHGWTGIYHNNVCGIYCSDTGPHSGECEFLYFSNGTKTVGINTNGRPFDTAILKRIISGFAFII